VRSAAGAVTNLFLAVVLFIVLVLFAALYRTLRG
jgi:hypothetical protein